MSRTALISVMIVAFAGCQSRDKAAKAPPPEVPPTERPSTLPAPPDAGAPGTQTAALLVAQDGYWVVAPASAPRRLPLTADKRWDAAGLKVELGAMQGKHPGSTLTLTADEAVLYQEVVTAMDAAMATGYSDVELSDRGGLPVKLPPEGAPTSAPSCPPGESSFASNAGPAPAPGAGASDAATLKAAPIVIIDKQGAGKLVPGGDAKAAPIAFSIPTGCDWKVAALSDWLKANPTPAGTLVVQADMAAPAGAILRVSKAAQGAGYGNVLFAVKAAR